MACGHCWQRSKLAGRSGPLQLFLGALENSSASIIAIMERLHCFNRIGAKTPVTAIASPVVKDNTFRFSIAFFLCFYKAAIPCAAQDCCHVAYVLPSHINRVCCYATFNFCAARSARTHVLELLRGASAIPPATPITTKIIQNGTISIVIAF